MKMRILAALLAAAMLLSTAALATDEAPAPAVGSDAVDIPTETVSPTTPTETAPVVSTSSAAYGGNSSWFDAELAEAQSLGLIPDRFAGADLRVPMSRAEFAAVAVRVYEKLSGSTIAIPGSNPFTDTTDADVLRAYAVGIVNGVSADAFSPHAQVSRQQVATMLTRIFKATHWNGWTLAGDSTYTAYGLDYGGVTLYADDDMIADYAFSSVYFLTKYGVVQGVGNNRFSPDAGCTREQGIALALRLYKAFAG